MKPICGCLDSQEDRDMERQQDLDFLQGVVAEMNKLAAKTQETLSVYVRPGAAKGISREIEDRRALLDTMRKAQFHWTVDSTTRQGDWGLGMKISCGEFEMILWLADEKHFESTSQATHVEGKWICKSEFSGSPRMASLKAKRAVLSGEKAVADAMIKRLVYEAFKPAALQYRWIWDQRNADNIENTTAEFLKSRGLDVVSREDSRISRGHPVIRIRAESKWPKQLVGWHEIRGDSIEVERLMVTPRQFMKLIEVLSQE